MKPYCDFPLCFIETQHAHAAGMSIGEAKGLAAGPSAMKFKALPPPLPRHVERRRYALLQAAAALRASGMEANHFAYTPQLCVETAEALLAEIEKREPK